VPFESGEVGKYLNAPVACEVLFCYLLWLPETLFSCEERLRTCSWWTACSGAGVFDGGRSWWNLTTKIRIRIYLVVLWV